MSTVVTIRYVGSKTSHIDNTVSDFNSPIPSTNTGFKSRRPFRSLGSIRYLDNSANANYKVLSTAPCSAWKRRD